jgi:predicted enzyme related to lactoylglutathione lyase
LDLKPAGDGTMEAEVARLEGLGARAVRLVTNSSDSMHTIMQDPEGNEFCVVRP